MMMGFRNFQVTGRRFAAGRYDHGRYIEGEATAIEFTTGVQQPTPNDLELLEEGKRTRKAIVLFTTFELRLVSKTTSADQVQWENEWYEVSALKPFRNLFPGNFKAICTKIENPR